jgi:hypothetical protein
LWPAQIEALKRKALFFEQNNSGAVEIADLV